MKNRGHKRARYLFLTLLAVAHFSAAQFFGSPTARTIGDNCAECTAPQSVEPPLRTGETMSGVVSQIQSALSSGTVTAFTHGNSVGGSVSPATFDQNQTLANLRAQELESARQMAASAEAARVHSAAVNGILFPGVTPYAPALPPSIDVVRASMPRTTSFYDPITGTVGSNPSGVFGGWVFDHPGWNNAALPAMWGGVPVPFML